MTSETIAALSTPSGVSALAVIRLSGPASRTILEGMLAEPMIWEPRRACYRTLQHNGAVLDDVVLTFWQAPTSFTGEDIVEISCHGNPRIVEAILRAALILGARVARPGEFTQRAFLNDRMSLTQAEGLLDLLYAPTERALASARAMKEGRLGEALEVTRTKLVDLLSHVEAALDFAEEGIEPRVGPDFADDMIKVQSALLDLLGSARLGQILHEGVTVAIVGQPNVGKSSLLNALLRKDRAIVAPTPGTTRDLIEATCSIRGLPVQLIDTAGQRESDDPVEIEGTRRARALLPLAHLILHVIAAHEPFTAETLELPEGIPVLRVANKIDLGSHRSSPADAIPVCALTGEGIPELEVRMETALLQGNETSATLTITARQEATLRRAASAVERCQENWWAGAGLEIISIDLRDALEELADVIGETTNEDVLTRLFKNFCIGK